MKKKPLVSIVTPCYNSSDFIADTIISVQKQSYESWEMLITDDGSSDSTVEIIEEFMAKDQRIKLFKIPNSGAAVARNNSIEASQGTYVAFLDSDDLWHPKKLEKQISFMIDNHYAFTFTAYQQMNQKGILLRNKIVADERLTYRELLFSNKIGCLTAVYNQEELGKIYMPLIRKRQDYGFWLSILKKIDFAYGLDEVLAMYRIRNFSVSSKKIEMLKWNWKLFREIENKNRITTLFLLLSNVFFKLKNNQLPQNK